MQHTLGEYIKHLRHRRGLNQSELGQERYSKSYVSALERGAIAPSPEALRFFAERLNQPWEDFEQLLQESEQAMQNETLQEQSMALQELSDETTRLLDLLLAGTSLQNLPLSRSIAALPHGALNTLPPSRQARYAFLKGLLAQQDGDLAAALPSLEYALAVAPARHQPAILDALGTNYALARMHETALSYHRRALNALDEETDLTASSDLCLLAALHCGEDCRVLGAYARACEYYERARQQLRASHNMNIAGQLYLGLGYCMYASLYQNQQGITPVEREHAFLQAVSFLAQSRTLYQACHDQQGESGARCLQAMVLLDFSTARQRVAQEQGKAVALLPSNCETLLSDAEEQCRQVLMTWQERDGDAPAPSIEIEVMLYTALSYLIRVCRQRATLARLSGYSDTALRERVFATSLCRQALDTLLKSAFPWLLFYEVATSTGSHLTAYDETLPRPPYLSLTSSTVPRHALSFVELYFAASEIAEELGRAATSAGYRQECYTRADQYFQAALTIQREAQPDNERDPGYYTRSYQRYISILQDRMTKTPEAAENITPTLFKLLKDALPGLS